jgi:small conductance mechanosensitive channel
VIASILAAAKIAALHIFLWLRWNIFQTPLRRSQESDLSYLAWLEESLQQVLIILAIAIVLIWLLRTGTRRLSRLSKAHEIISPVRAQQLKTLVAVINGVGIFIIVFIAAMQILPIFGVNMGPLLASAGVAGIAIGFGAQSLVHDVVNGFFILVENQYGIGDVVSIAGVKGSVETMTLRRTVLRDADGTIHVVPNSQITVVSNQTRDWSQVTMHVAVAYGEPSDKVIRLLQEIGAEMRDDPAYANLMVADPQVPGIERVAANEVDYLMLVKTLPGAAQYSVSRELRRRIKERFEKEGVKPAGPAPIYVLDRNTPVGK